MKLSLKQLKLIIKEEINKDLEEIDKEIGMLVMDVYKAATEAAEACRLAGDEEGASYFRSVIEKCAKIRRANPTPKHANKMPLHGIKEEIESSMSPRNALLDKAKADIEDNQAQTGDKITLRMCRDVLKYWNEEAGESFSPKEILQLSRELYDTLTRHDNES